MESFPLFAKLKDQPVLVVGGGEMALAKLRLLLAAKAVPTVVAPRPTADIVRLAAEKTVRWVDRDFAPGDIDGQRLVFGATGALNSDAAVAQAARARGVFVNIVDRPELSDFIMPAVVDRGEVVIGISTQGAAPVLARWVRGIIENALPQNIGRLAAFARRFRSAVHVRIGDQRLRRRFWEDFFDGPLARSVLAGREREATRALIRAINDSAAGLAASVGHAEAVVVTSSDPEDLSLKALRLLRTADVLVHDAPVDPAILDLARRDAVRVVAGQKTQSVNAMLRHGAAAGHRILYVRHAADARQGKTASTL